MKTATAVQLKVLEAFKSHVRHRRVSPTIRELAEDLGCHPYAVLCNVRRLIAKGYLRKVGGIGMARNLRLVDATSGTFKAPVRCVECSRIYFGAKCPCDLGCLG